MRTVVSVGVVFQLHVRRRSGLERIAFRLLVARTYVSCEQTVVSTRRDVFRTTLAMVNGSRPP